MPIRRILPLILLNMVVVGSVAAVIVAYPTRARFAALAMPILFVLNFAYVRNEQLKHAVAIATGKATPPSRTTKRNAMWVLVLWGFLSYVSGAFNIPQLLQQHDSGLWLGWSVKMTIGTIALWSAYKVRKNLQLSKGKAQR
jgi:branched-subunit amino acid transport protein